MKIWVIFFLLLVPSVYAVDVSIPELFQIDSDSVSGKEIYYYAGDKLISVNENYKYQDRANSDFESRSLPFGQALNVKNRFSFTGKELDKNLYYFNARYYDSSLGKFTSVDPIENNHAYSYVANNPMNFVDPDGMDLRMILEFWDTDVQENIRLANNRLAEINDFLGADLFSMNEEGYVLIQGLEDYQGNEDQMEVLGVFKQLVESETAFTVVNQQKRSSLLGACFVSCTNRIVLNSESGSTFKRPLGENFEMVEFTPLVGFVHEATHATGEGETGAVEMANKVRSGPKGYFYTAESGVMTDFEEGYMPPVISEEYSYYLTPEQFDVIKTIRGQNNRQGIAREIGTVGYRPDLLMISNYNFGALF